MESKLIKMRHCNDRIEQDPRLTNIRYADDILMFAQSRSEAVSMLESLAGVLRQYGLELNAKKTKVLTTEATQDEPSACATRHGDVMILGTTGQHKYDDTPCEMLQFG